MKKILLISLMLTSACSSYGNDPASQFAGVTYDSAYYEKMAKMQEDACKLRSSSCSPYYTGSY